MILLLLLLVLSVAAITHAVHDVVMDGRRRIPTRPDSRAALPR